MSSLSLPNYLVDDTSLQRWHRNCSWRKGRPAWVGAAAQVSMQWMAKAVMVPARAKPLVKGVVIPRAKPLVQGVVVPRAQPLVKGGSDAHSDKSDDASSVAGGSLPSNVPTEASGIEGDPNAADIGGDEGPMRYEPVHEVDGDWDDQTPVGGKPGAWGIVCGNWGGQWHDEMLHKHMDFDLKSSAGTILLLQEAREELLQHLKQPGDKGIVKQGQDTHGDGGAYELGATPNRPVLGLSWT